MYCSTGGFYKFFDVFFRVHSWGTAEPYKVIDLSVMLITMYHSVGDSSNPEVPSSCSSSEKNLLQMMEGKFIYSFDKVPFNIFPLSYMGHEKTVEARWLFL